MNDFSNSHELHIDNLPDDQVHCFYSDTAYIQSEEAYRSNYGAVVIALQHCIEYDSYENCASEEETFDFWSRAKKIQFLTTQMNLDMENQEEPL